MAVKKYYQMPAGFRLNHTKDHWIQDAMIIFWNLCLNYDPKQGAFDHYVRFMMPRRLTSIQRDIFRENPKTDENPENPVKERMFISGDDDMAEKRESEESISVEAQYINEEARKILWECIEKLEPISGQLFMRHEF
ncbi:MAG: hypothetical protein HC887_12385 [Desulfobacteraceae bacterium]|nr:hypothetical protein [Desulfobacteraceae bacterium]